jgi:hypothetical protein
MTRLKGPPRGLPHCLAGCVACNGRRCGINIIRSLAKTLHKQQQLFRQVIAFELLLPFYNDTAIRFELLYFSLDTIRDTARSSTGSAPRLQPWSLDGCVG